MQGKTWIIAVAALAALFVAVAAWRLWPRSAVAPSEVGRPVAETFLTHLREGRVDAAWESTSAEFKSDEGRESFRVYVAENPVLRGPLDFASYEPVELHGLKRGECHYHPPTGETPKVRVVVGLDGSDWKVDGVFVE